MRIRLETSDRDPYWLVGDPALNEREEMSQSGQDRVQVTRNQQGVGGAEWESEVIYDRKNQRLVFTAVVYRKFDSEWARMDFLSRLAAMNPAAQEHRWTGNVWVRIDKEGTHEFREWKLTNAVVGITGTELMSGIGLNITYTVTVGGFSGEVNEGESVYGNLVGSGESIWRLSFSISEIDAALAPFGPSVVDYISANISIGQPGFTDWGYLTNWMPAGDTNPYPGIPGFISYELPLSSFADDWVTEVNDYWIANDIPLTMSRSGDTITIESETGTPIDRVELDIIKTFADPYGPDNVRMYQRFGTQVVSSTFNLVGTVGGVDYNLTGLAEA